MRAYSRKGSGGRIHQIDILRTDHHIYRLVVAKALIHTGKTGAENLHQLIADHDAGYDIALTDEVCHKGILWLVVDLLGSAHLLDITLIHDYDGI